MPLAFHRRAATSERGAHYAATTGAWPHQTRYVIERRGWEWSIDVQRHAPGLGFVTYRSENSGLRTLADARLRCERIARPAPIDRTSSSYTDG